MADDASSSAASKAPALSEVQSMNTSTEGSSVLASDTTETVGTVDDRASSTSQEEPGDGSTPEPEKSNSISTTEPSNSEQIQPSATSINLPPQDLPTVATHSHHPSGSVPSIDVAENSVVISPNSSVATPARAYINVESHDLPIGPTDFSSSVAMRLSDISTTPTPHQRHLEILSLPHQTYEALQTQFHPSISPIHDATMRNSNSSPVVKPSGHSDGSLSRRDEFRHGERSIKPESSSSSPGVFTPTSSPLRPEFSSSDALATYSSPYLQFTQRQMPKETHLAEVDVDPISGRKLINHYEIMDELGRGVHGKVKLGRNLESNSYVAIKIIERFSKRRRIGRSGNQENKIKREIAILKKARHPNIVGLLEVIDDPAKKKVYIVLEHVELGEVRWRTKGEEEICLLEYRRGQREANGVEYGEAAQQEDEQILQRCRRRFERAERSLREDTQRRRESNPDSSMWSLEHGGGSEIDEPYPVGTSHLSFPEGGHELDVTHDTIIHDTAIHDSDVRRNQEESSTSVEPKDIKKELEITPKAKSDVDPSERSNAMHKEKSRSSESLPEQYHTALEGTMYGPYDSSPPRDYGEGTIIDYVSIEESSKEDHVLEHYRYVPLMTLNEARRAIRETLLGLEYLHYQGVIHRDIKPANLLQTIDHHIKISDFGVSYLGKAAKDQNGEDQSESEAQDVDDAVELAKTVGTPAFYAPELCQTDCDDDDTTAAPVTGQIDVWALGVTLYCLVFGRVPFHDHNTFALMRRIAEEDVYIPRCRLKAVEERSSSRLAPRSRRSMSMNCNKRLPHEWEYEEVDDDLYDLLMRLLTKDPFKRMKLAEMKRHPWLLRDIGDPIRWIEETDPSRIFHGKRIEVSKEDVDVAVVPLNLVDHLRSYARKIGGAFGIGKNVSRTRAKSSAAAVDTQPSSAASSSSSISHDARRQEHAVRRASLKPDEVVFAALKASRDVDHPLSHSVTASPELRDGTHFFIGPSSRPESPITPVDPNHLDHHHLDRPRIHDRAISSASATGSIRTIRQSDLNAWGVTGASTTSALPSTPHLHDVTSGVGLTSLLGGAKKRILRSVRSRERNRSRDVIQSFDSKSADEDTHSEASVAVSRAVATGEVNPPLALQDGSVTSSSAAASPISSRTPSVSAYEMLKAEDGGNIDDGLSRNSSRSSMGSRSRHGYDQPVNAGRAPIHNSPLGEVNRLDHAYDKLAKAKEEQIRRLIQEGEAQHQVRQNQAQVQPSLFLPLLAACPPSPDDIIFHRRQASSSFDDANIGSAARPIVTSSSEDQFNSGMSQSVSNPSIPSVASANSSVVEYGTLAAEDFNEKEIGVPSARTITPPPPLHEDSDGYDADNQVEDAVEDDEDDDSDDDFIEMTNRKPRASAFTLGNNGQLSSQRTRRPTGTSVKTARSGSNNTMMRVASNGDSDGN